MNNSVLTLIRNATINLYPNPTEEYFQIDGIEGSALLIISDLNCRVLLTKQIESNEHISVANLPKGVYIAKIISAIGTVEKKLVNKLIN